MCEEGLMRRTGNWGASGMLGHICPQLTCVAFGVGYSCDCFHIQFFLCVATIPSQFPPS